VKKYAETNIDIFQYQGQNGNKKKIFSESVGTTILDGVVATF